MHDNKAQHLLILGASGMVGSQLLKAALANPQVAAITAPTRRPLSAHPRLNNPVLDFNDLPADASWWQADAVLCALGTTLKQAGSKQAFRQVDHDLVLSCAQLAKSAGTPTWVFNSSLGANPRAGSFYLRTKGETEQELGLMGFTSLTCVRPALLDAGKRPEPRPLEELGLVASKLFRPLIPARYQPISTTLVARCMLEVGLTPVAGISLIESEEIALY